LNEGAAGTAPSTQKQVAIMSKHNTQNNEDIDSDKKNSSNELDTRLEIIKSDSGDYKIFLSEEPSGHKAIKIYRVDGEQIPWEHQDWLDSFIYHQDTTSVSIRGVNQSRYRIGISEASIRLETCTKLVDMIKESL